MGLFSLGTDRTPRDAPAGLVTVSRADPVCTIRINNAAHTNVFTRNLVA